MFYIYAGYPMILIVLSFFLNKKVKKEDFRPTVSILISAYNEAQSIAKTLENKLALVYPKEKLEIIVISDGSTDETDQIVKRFEPNGVKLIRQEPRAGKTAALNLSVTHATGEIIVFCDANSIYEEKALTHLTKNFNDPGVGYVTGKMIYIRPDDARTGDGCSAYMKYENFLRLIETRAGSIVGVDGGIDATRRKFYKEMAPDQLPDFVLPLKIVEQGYRVVYEPEAVLEEPLLTASKDEYNMRVRVVLRSLWTLWDMRHMLYFKDNKRFAWQLWSHKLLRYLSFVFLLTSYFTNMLLWSSGGFFKIFFILQNLCYLSAIIAPCLKNKGRLSNVLYLAHYFVLLHLASAHALVKFLLGKKQTIWTPRKG
jgi:glycosyltransferase involved in cell wall biosynthesis